MKKFSTVVLALALVAFAVNAAPIPKYSCADTDGGNRPLIHGTASGYYNRVWYSYNDFCIDTGNIREYWCNEKYRTWSDQSCGTDSWGSAYCIGSDVYKNFTDRYCGSGACGSTVIPTWQETCPWGCAGGVCNPIPPNSCSDSDGGVSPFVLGTVSGYIGGNPYSNDDYCYNDEFLFEYYCAGSYGTGTYVSCGNVTNTSMTCSNGRCI